MTGLRADFAEFTGQRAEPARYAVNEAMIRNWGEARDDRNPVYVDDAAAKAAGRPGVVAPPAMCSTMDHGRVPALLRDPGAAPARARWRISRTRG